MTSWVAKVAVISSATAHCPTHRPAPAEAPAMIATPSESDAAGDQHAPAGRSPFHKKPIPAAMKGTVA